MARMRRAHESLQGPSFLHVDSVPRPSQQVDTGTTRFETQLRAPLKTSSSFEVVPVRQAIGSSQQASIGKFANNPAETLIDTGKSSVVLLLALCKAGNLRQNHRGRLCQERPRVCGFFHLRVVNPMQGNEQGRTAQILLTVHHRPGEKQHRRASQATDGHLDTTERRSCAVAWFARMPSCFP